MVLAQKAQSIEDAVGIIWKEDHKEYQERDRTD